MFSSFFQTKSNDLDGRKFQEQFLKTPASVLIDVRTAEEFRAGSLPGAINMDIMQADFARKADALDPNATYFIFCRSGNRSSQACSILERKGLKTFNLLGGISAWPC